MKKPVPFPAPQLSAVALAVLTLVAHSQAMAQESSPLPPQDNAQKELQQVVVTGTASASGTRKIDTSFSITTATEEQLKAAAPSSMLRTPLMRAKV